MIRLFTGWDPREAIGHAVFLHSLFRRAGVPVSVTPIGANVRKTDGTNAFSLARFEIPRLCDYKGWAIYLDGSDMLMLCDIAELWALRDEKYAVQVVKHEYEPRAKRKYIGTPMEASNEAYPKKNWSSVMLLNAERWKDRNTWVKPHRFAAFHDEEIGSIPNMFNYLCDENGQYGGAKIAHYTLGSPWMPHYANGELSGAWHAELRDMHAGC